MKTLKTPIICRGSLQDLWHYATGIRYGAQRDSAFATPSLFGRLELIEDAAKCLDRIGYENIYDTPWEHMLDQCNKRTPRNLDDIEKIGEALLDLVNAECKRLGIEGATGEAPR